MGSHPRVREVNSVNADKEHPSNPRTRHQTQRSGRNEWPLGCSSRDWQPNGGNLNFHLPGSLWEQKDLHPSCGNVLVGRVRSLSQAAAVGKELALDYLRRSPRNVMGPSSCM